jgi:streptomycin 6-kinase
MLFQNCSMGNQRSIDMTFTNKKATLNQLDNINQLIRASKSHWGYDEKFLNQYMEITSITQDYLEKNTANMLYLNQEFIAFYSFTLDADEILTLDKFFLDPHHMGKGYGRKLWQACCDTAKYLGKTEFIIWSDLNTETFYLKLGCKKIGVKQSPIRPGIYPPILRYKLI